MGAAAGWGLVLLGLWALAGCRGTPTLDEAPPASVEASAPSDAVARAVLARHPDLVPHLWSDEGEGRHGAHFEAAGRRFILVVGPRGELLSRREPIDVRELPAELRGAAPLANVLAAERVTVLPHGASRVVYRLKGPDGWTCVDRGGAPAVEFP